MRLLLCLLFLIPAFQCISQKPGNMVVSGIVLSIDSVPIPNVAIVNIRSGKVMRTNMTGFFQAEVAAEDSLLVYHIAYKNKFIRVKDNGRYIFLEPDIREIGQVDIIDRNEKDQRYLGETVLEIKRMAPLKKLSGYELHSMQEYFINENGSHNKGFGPFFGPTIPLPLQKLEAKISQIKDRQQLRKLTSHYHLEKKKK